MLTSNTVLVPIKETYKSSGTIEKKAFSNDEFLVDMVNLIDNNDDEDTDEE
jgi:hypothetical protein